MKMFLVVVEIVSFLYAILMNTGNAQSSSPTLPEATINLVTEALCMLNFMGTVDLKVLQVSNEIHNFEALCGIQTFLPVSLTYRHVRQ